MSDSRNEQWVNIKFLIKLKKSTMETFILLTETYSEDCLSHPCIFEGHKQFSDGRESVEDDYLGHPCTSVTTNNVEGGWDVIQKDHRLGVGTISNMFSVDRKSVWFILTDELNMKNVHAEMVSKMLMAEQNKLIRNCVLTISSTLRMNRICWNL